MRVIEKSLGRSHFVSCGVMALLAFHPSPSFAAMADTETVSDGDAVEVRSFPEFGSGAELETASDYAFVATLEGCRIQWSAVQLKPPNSRRLVLQRECQLPFSEQLPLHRAILQKIFAEWPTAEFDGISWGSFRHGPDWSWNMPIALASAQSADWRDYRENYPNSKYKSLNHLFVKLARETDAYHPLRELMREFGADVELVTVEKVFVLKARELHSLSTWMRWG
jgi:hypothetical protein